MQDAGNRGKAASERKADLRGTRLLLSLKRSGRLHVFTSAKEVMFLSKVYYFAGLCTKKTDLSGFHETLMRTRPWAKWEPFRFGADANGRKDAHRQFWSSQQFFFWQRFWRCSKFEGQKKCLWTLKLFGSVSLCNPLQHWTNHDNKTDSQTFAAQWDTAVL